MAQQQDVDFFSGNHVLFGVRAIDESTNDILDLSGTQELTYAIAKKASSAPLFSKTLGNGVTIVDPTHGLAQIQLNPDDSESLQGVYYHELRLKNALGKIATLMYGTVLIHTNLVRG